MGKFDMSAMLAAPAVNTQYAAAAELHAEIMSCRKTAAESLYQMAMGFKKMRDEKLYAALGYDNFRDYCEKHAGMQHSSIYNYIKVVETLPADVVQSSGQIGIVKLKLLTTLSDTEREEIVESTDLENTTVSKLKEKIKELEDRNKSAEAENAALKDSGKSSAEEQEKLNEQINRLKGENMKLRNSAEKAAEFKEAKEHLEKQLEDAKNHAETHGDSEKVKELNGKIMELERYIKELENQPKDVVFERDTEETERLKAEIARLEAELDDNKPDTTGYQFDVLYDNAKEVIRKTALFALNSKCPWLIEKARGLKGLIDSYLE